MTSELEQHRQSLSSIIAETEGLAEIEAIIASKLKSDAPVLTDISSYLVKLGGKRIRPVLCLISARALGMASPSRELLEVAAGIELIHSATLLHDDIIDKSPIRRKEMSAYLKYGLPGTLLAGDFLLVRAFSLCAHLDSFIVEATEDACVELTEGEVLETPLCAEPHSLESAIEIARKKTGALFRLSCECAAHLCNASPETVAAMRDFGEALGIAFQILDDVLDVTGTEEILGKAAGVDIRERKPSVVNVLWLASGAPLARRMLEEADDDEAAFVEASLAELRQGSPVVDKARDLARLHATRAAEALDRALSLSGADSSSTAAWQLRTVIQFVIERLH